MAKNLETNLCKINYSESLEDLAQATISLLNEKIIEYNTFFGNIVLHFTKNLKKHKLLML